MSPRGFDVGKATAAPGAAPPSPTDRLTKFLTYDLKYTMALNSGMSETSGRKSNTSVRPAWRESVKQLSTTALNSFNRDKTRQRPCIEIRHVKSCKHVMILCVSFLMQVGIVYHFCRGNRENVTMTTWRKCFSCTVG